MMLPGIAAQLQAAQVYVLLCCLLVTTLLTSCAKQPGPPATPRSPDLRIQYGLASWYGREHQGRRTASGERFDSAQLTAAHRTAPFGTHALVTNLDNGRTVRVRINDRGPASKEYVLDLSYAAARQLDMVRAGVARVKVEFLGPHLPTSYRLIPQHSGPTLPGEDYGCVVRVGLMFWLNRNRFVGSYLFFSATRRA